MPSAAAHIANGIALPNASRINQHGGASVGRSRIPWACGLHIQKMFSGGRPRRIWPTVS
jgi:hypothetical protein